MAYFRNKKYGGGRTSHKRRSWKGRNGYSTGKKSYKKSGSTSIQKSVMNKLKGLQLGDKFGPTEKLTLKAESSYWVYGSGPYYPLQYLEMPFSAVVRTVALESRRTKAYLTGVTIEFDLKHQGAVDVLLLGITVGGEVGLGSCDVATPQITFGKDGRGEGGILSMGHLSERLKTICASSVTEYGNDDSLFRCKRNCGPGEYSGKIEVSCNGAKKVVFGKGKAHFQLPAVAGSVVMGLESLRVYIPVDKEVPLGGYGFNKCDFTAILGIRMAAEMPGEKSSKVGSVDNMRLSLHCRARS